MNSPQSGYSASADCSSAAATPQSWPIGTTSNLGVDPLPSDYGHSSWQQTAGPTAFAPFSMDTGYFGSQQQAWMINFRVRSLDAMVPQLQKSQLEVKVDPEKYPNGRFGA